jgi:hypothetical protein
VIAIIAILAVVVILTLNPAALLQQSRDSNRLSDLSTMNDAINVYNTDQSGASSYSLGVASTTYVSVYDPSATSTAGTSYSTMGIPATSTGWSDHCAASSTERSVNGQGWLPINFSNISSGSPFGSLPVDPTNNTSSLLYYTYMTNGSQYELSVPLESTKYLKANLLTTDVDPSRVAAGSNPLLIAQEEGLVGYWNFEEGGGTTAHNQSGNGNNGTLSDNGSASLPAWSSGKVGSWSLYFNPPSSGSQAYVTMAPVNAAQATGTAITVGLWVDPNATQVGGGWLFRNGTNCDENYGLNLNGPSGGSYSLAFTTYDNSCNPHNVTLSGYVVPQTSWSYITLVFIQDTSITGYVNGVSQRANSFPFISALSTSYLEFGANTGASTQEYNGYLDDVRIYNRALSPAEVMALYNAEK